MNHRPTLEGKRGYEKTIRDSIQHARLLRGYTRLKFRQDVAGVKRHKGGVSGEGQAGTNAVANDGCKETSQLDSGLRLDYSSDSDADCDADSDAHVGVSGGVVEGALELVTVQNNSDATVLPDKARAEDAVIAAGSDAAVETVGAADAALGGIKPSGADSVPDSAPDSDSHSNSYSQSDSESDSDSDTTLMMAELQRLRKDNSEHERKRSWRSTRRFDNKQPSESKYTTNSLASSTHKQFMSKYMR